MKKFILIIFLSLVLFGCQSIVLNEVNEITEKVGLPLYDKSKEDNENKENNNEKLEQKENLTIVQSNNSKRFKFTQWQCAESSIFKDKKILLTIGYFPELESPTIPNLYWGKLTLKGVESPIDVFYNLHGVVHEFFWKVGDSRSIINIHLDGTGAYYDFTGAKEGESRDPKEIYDCSSPFSELVFWDEYNWDNFYKDKDF